MKLSDLVSPGLMKSSLRRFWPLWLAGIVVLVLSVDVPIYVLSAEVVRTVRDPSGWAASMDTIWTIVNCGSWAYALVGSIVVALALSEYLFDSRAATFVGALPLRRQTVYVTTVVTGLLMLLALPAIADLLLVPLRLSLGPVVTIGAILSWYLLAAALSFVLFAFAMLSCHLAGSRPVAVVLYNVIGFLAACLSAAVRLAIDALVYGQGQAVRELDLFSPAVWLLRTSILWNDPELAQRGTLACYVVAAAITLLLTGRLFRRRALETAGDSISYAPVRPVLKYLAGASMALLFCSVFRLTRLWDDLGSLPATGGEAALMALMLVLGGFVGILFAEMIMSRSTHVMSRCWRGGLVLAAVSVAFVGICYFDVTGAERYVPDQAEVESVELQGNYSDGMTIASKEGVEAVCDLHRDIISYGGVNELGDSGDSIYTIGLTYHLKGGRTVVRSYPVVVANLYNDDGDFDVEPSGEAGQLVGTLARIANTKEGRTSRFEKVLGANEDGQIMQLEYLRDDGVYASVEFSEAERKDLVEGALRKDLLEEEAGAYEAPGWAYSNYDASLQVLKPSADGGQEVLLDLRLDETCCPNVVNWVRTHHREVELIPWGE